MSPIQLLQSKIGVKTDGQLGPKSFVAFCDHFNLTPIQGAHLLGQCEHETGGFNVWEENLNYSAIRLMQVWPNRFTMTSARLMERKPVDIANFVYGGRMGNTQENDGWNFRGRGAIQLTGRHNYQEFANFMNDDDIMSDPDLVSGEYAFDSALFFFRKNGIFQMIKNGSPENIETVTKRVNGGTHGLPDRIAKTKKYLSWIA